MTDSTIAVETAAEHAREFERRRTHFADSFGPVCRVYGEDPLTSTDYCKITHTRRELGRTVVVSIEEVGHRREIYR